MTASNDLLTPPQPPARSWLFSSLWACVIVAALVSLSTVFFTFTPRGGSRLPPSGTEPGPGFRCRVLVQNGEWVFPVASGLLCLLSFYSLISMNISDPGVLHRGAFEQDPEAPYKARVNGRLYDMPWCPTYYFHRLPRTFHCESCDICVEEFDHHCRWVNNCVGHRNIRLYLLLLVSLCLYLGTVLATCVLFIIRRRHVALLDQTMTYPHSPKGPHWEELPVHSILVAVPAGALLLPLILQLFIKAVAVGAARRPYEEQVLAPRNVVEGNGSLDKAPG
ncbi:palmitoyltransferase ZDHHC19-like [Callospermophilus lateralis]